MRAVLVMAGGAGPQPVKALSGPHRISESMGHTRNCGLVVRARGGGHPEQEVISPKFRSTSSKATRAYRPRGLPLLLCQKRFNEASLPMTNYLSPVI